MLAAVALAKSGFRFWEGGERRGSSFVDWGVDCGMVLVVIVVTFFSFFFFLPSMIPFQAHALLLTHASVIR